jgi:hypothetical protein
MSHRDAGQLYRWQMKTSLQFYLGEGMNKTKITN